MLQRITVFQGFVEIDEIWKCFLRILSVNHFLVWYSNIVW